MRICREHPLVGYFNAFLYSPLYVAFVGALVAASNIFNIELYVYTGIILTGIAICLFSRDLLPLMPPFAMFYMSPSLNNNPGFNDHSVFSVSGNGLYLAFMLSLFLISLFYRLAKDPNFGGKRFLYKKRKLLSGLLILCAAYALSGLGSAQLKKFGGNNLFFVFLQFAALVPLYYLFSGGVLWEKAPKAYLCWIGTTIGYVVLAELINIYLTVQVVHDGRICRENLFTGWGHYNNMAAMLIMAIPMAFYLTTRGRWAWFGYVSAFIMFIGLIFTCSRGPILIGTLIFGVCYIATLVTSKHARRQYIVHIAVVAFAAFVAIKYANKLIFLFSYVTRYSFLTDGRIATYKAGMEQFLQYPIFGATFFPIEELYSFAESSFFLSVFPPRWHNTVIQLLASGGVVALAAYSVHRLQTIKLFIKDFSTEKLFVAFSILALLLCSMVDCHFFNIGPILYYSPALAVVEFGLKKKEK